jgi:hypothetical protein
MTQKKRGLSRGLDALLAGTGLMHTTTVDKTPLPLTPTSTKPATKSTKKTNNINQAKKNPCCSKYRQHCYGDVIKNRPIITR